VTTTAESVRIAEQLQRTFDGESWITREVTELSDKQLSSIPIHQAQNMIRDAIVNKRWKEIGRQCLSVHPELAAEVALAASDTVYPEVFRAMPYMNPMVVYPDAPASPGWCLGEKVRVIGFWCYTLARGGTVEHGRIQADSLRDLVEKLERATRTTSDVDSDTLGLLVVVEVLDEAGRHKDLEINGYTVWLDQPKTLSQMVDGVMERFQWEEDNVPTGTHPHDRKRRAYTRRIAAQVIGTLLYLCSTTLDSEPVPMSAVRRASTLKQSRRHPLSLFRVGWTVGTALSKYRAASGIERSDTPSVQGDLGHQQDPQHRRAHFKIVWTGPGRSVPKLAFVSAYWTHRELLGEEGTNTLRPVR
jgi:hypothetical protein